MTPGGAKARETPIGAICSEPPPGSEHERVIAAARLASYLRDVLAMRKMRDAPSEEFEQACWPVLKLNN